MINSDKNLYFFYCNPPVHDIMMAADAGPVAQRQSVRLITAWSLVRIQPGPQPPLFRGAFSFNHPIAIYKSPRLKLVNPSPTVSHTLSLAGIDMFLEIHDDLQKAIASF
jgi:hypothetical protein